jgi:Flp pilus assembly protein TadG
VEEGIVKLVKSCLEWLFSEDRRRAQRHDSLPLVVFYWDGAEPVPHAALNISSSGLYLLTKQRWYPGTVVTMTLQRAQAAPEDTARSIAVFGRVVRQGKDGVAFEFIWPKARDKRRPETLSTNEADMKTFKDFFTQIRADKRLQAERGQALIEYILVLPIVFLLLVNLVNFGGFFFAWITVANAARAGADYAVLGGVSAGSPTSPTWSQITDVITQETSSLPNGSTVTVSGCQNNNGRLSAYPGSGSTCTSVPSDPEPASYVLTSIAVSYNYSPFIAAFQFPSLGVYLTLPPTTIKQQASMRSIQ